MDFGGGGGYIMSHAIDHVKPWRKKMLWRTFAKGKRPSGGDRAFFSNASSPIRLYCPFRLGLKKLDLLVGSIVGRIIG
jgi:hypothetical protein